MSELTKKEIARMREIVAKMDAHHAPESMEEAEKETVTEIHRGASCGNKVSLTPEEVEPLRRANRHKVEAQEKLSNLILSFERQKKELLSEIQNNQQVINARIEELQDKHDFPVEANIDLDHEPGSGGSVTW